MNKIGNSQWRTKAVLILQILNHIYLNSNVLKRCFLSSSLSKTLLLSSIQIIDGNGPRHNPCYLHLTSFLKNLSQWQESLTYSTRHQWIAQAIAKAQSRRIAPTIGKAQKALANGHAVKWSMDSESTLDTNHVLSTNHDPPNSICK